MRTEPDDAPFPSSATDAKAPPDLLSAALAVRERAWAPYSGFRVGAALLAEDGRVFVGANVENASYGLSICAERSALVSAIAAGATPGGFRGLVVVGDTRSPIAPCGACRQVMLELCGPGMEVWLANLEGRQRRTTPSALLPEAFAPDDLS